ncbi:putative bifunctional diguanylate cyclase/phosphodiesterase [Propionivibrio sp.]|uniref:putative bifunctional diguanylate cyclase/phosphodiesterase n=1 Tax=Propionivibrio sp. TaxID=2212460 RepID=UPI003BF41E45
MRLNTRYALYLSGALLSGALLMLLMVGVLLVKDGDQFRIRLQKELKYHLILDQQESLITTAEYLGRRLFNPLHQLDISTLNREIEEIRAWLPVRRFEIVDLNGIILTDGSRENPQYGQHIEDERIGHFDLICPHVYSFPGESGAPNGGIGLAFAISRDAKPAGYARVVLSENAFNTSVERIASLLQTMWSSALDMLYTLGLVAGLGALLIAAAFSWLFSRRLSAPLTEMSLAARKFADGQLDYVIPLNSQDEIGELAGSLNTMAHQIWKSGRLLGKAQEMTGVGGWEFDALLDHFDWTPQVSHIFRVAHEMLPSTRSSLAAMVHAEERSALLDIFIADYSQNPNFSLEFRLLRHDGEQRTLQVLGEVTLGEDGQLQTLIGTFQDITERKQAEEHLRLLASFDPLTGLPNRALFKDRLSHALVHADRNHGQVGLLFIDLDHFKTINDTLGHSFGDELLKQVALRLDNTVREIDTVARLGGDEFTIILENVRSGNHAAMVANKVIEALAPAVFIGSHELYVTASIGITMYPADAIQVETLLRNADTAMYRAKDEGRNTFRFFTREMDERIQVRQLLERSLHNALQKDEFVLYYQPQIDVHSGDIVGFEALLRWRREDGTLVSPVEFIPVLEETGMIVEVGAWVIAEACRWLAEWRNVHGLEATVAVNLSPRQFRDAELSSIVALALHETGLPPSALDLEITESSLVDAPATLVTMEELRRMGVGLAIDDFGTGYSSLSYLKRFPITKLKIDQSFVRDITVDEDGAAIVSAIISLAHILQLQVVAEGVEKIEELGYLRRHGCNYVQGYLVSRPLDEFALAEWYNSLANSLVGQARFVPFHLARN